MEFMADFLTPEERSERMSKIRGSDTRPELVVRRFLHSRGFRYRLHAEDLPGRPDVVLPRYRSVVFVHGCFWHAHSCQNGRVPESRSDFWKEKFRNNKLRDARNKRALRKLGWWVHIVWECSLRNKKSADKALATLERKILSVLGTQDEEE